MSDDAVRLDLMKRIGKVAAEMERLRKDSIAETGKYDYQFLSLPNLLAAVKTPLHEAGLSLLQPATTTPDGLTRVDTILVDLETGESFSFPGLGWQTKGDPQAAGSYLSYVRRYNITSLFALEVADDDGAAAHRAASDPQRRTQAEIKVREIIGSLTKDQRTRFVDEFKTEFGTGLTELPENRHGDALTWAHEWLGRQMEGEEATP